jgi:hypothetical protein
VFHFSPTRSLSPFLCVCAPSPTSSPRRALPLAGGRVLALASAGNRVLALAQASGRHRTEVSDRTLVRVCIGGRALTLAQAGDRILVLALASTSEREIVSTFPIIDFGV